MEREKRREISIFALQESDWCESAPFVVELLIAA